MSHFVQKFAYFFVDSINLIAIHFLISYGSFLDLKKISGILFWFCSKIISKKIRIKVVIPISLFNFNHTEFLDETMSSSQWRICCQKNSSCQRNLNSLWSIHACEESSLKMNVVHLLSYSNKPFWSHIYQLSVAIENFEKFAEKMICRFKKKESKPSISGLFKSIGCKQHIFTVPKKHSDTNGSVPTEEEEEEELDEKTMSTFL